MIRFADGRTQERLEGRGPTEPPSADPTSGPGDDSPAEDPTNPGGAEPTPTDFERVCGEVAELAARVNAVEYRFLERIRAFDALFQEFGGNTGARSSAHWLAWRTGLGPVAARERVRVARALSHLPRVANAMRRGQLSYSRVRALTRICRPDNEEKLLEFALEATASQLEQFVRAWRWMDRQEEAEADTMRHASRHLTLRVEEDGGVRVTGLLEPETGALLKKALELAAHRLVPGGEEGRAPRRSTHDDPAARHDPAHRATACQRRADALGVVAEAALQAGLRLEGETADPVPTVSAEAPSGVSAEAPADVSAESSGRAGEESVGHGDVSAESPEPESRERAASREITRSDRYHVVLHVDLDALQAPASDVPHPAPPARGPGDGWVPGTAILEGVGRISTEKARRLTCDAGVVPMTHGGGDGAGNRCGCGDGNGDRDGGGDREGVGAWGETLNVGRKTRTVPPALRRALEERDRCCRFPGCELRHLQSHHVVHWADDGETRLENMALLCPTHHWAVHEGGFTMELDPDGTARFRDPLGRLVPDAPKLPATSAEVLDDVREEHIREGLVMDEWTATPGWLGEPFDLPHAIDALWDTGDP